MIVLVPKWFEMVMEMYIELVVFANLMVNWQDGKLNRQKYKMVDGLL